MLYTDPSGEFLGLFFRAMSFIGGTISNWINGYDDPVGRAWKNSGRLTNEVSNCMQFPIYTSDNTHVSAGLDPFGLGISANVVRKSGSNVSGLSLGFSALGGFHTNAGTTQVFGDLNLGTGIGMGNNYWGWNASATYGGYGVGYGRTYYGNATGPDGQSNAQTVGSATLFWDGGSFTLQNDVKYLGDEKDRWRTNAFELTIGDFSFGNSIYTNLGEDASNGEQNESLLSPIWGKNRNEGFSAWKSGKVYFAPTWIGVRTGNRIERIGYSFPGAQDLFQNGVHGRIPFGKQNYYLNYDYFRDKK
jgi:hypothetical protein